MRFSISAFSAGRIIRIPLKDDEVWKEKKESTGEEI